MRKNQAYGCALWQLALDGGQRLSYGSVLVVGHQVDFLRLYDGMLCGEEVLISRNKE